MTGHCLTLAMSDPKWPNFGTYVRTIFFRFRPHRDPTYLFGVTSVRIADHTSLVTNVKFFPATFGQDVSDLAGD